MERWGIYNFGVAVPRAVVFCFDDPQLHRFAVAVFDGLPVDIEAVCSMFGYSASDVVLLNVGCVLLVVLSTSQIVLPKHTSIDVSV